MGDKKKGISTNTMIELGLGGAVLLEGIALAYLFKKVNDLSAKTDPATNDNKNIAQYVSLLETSVHARLKDQDAKIGAIDEALKKISIPTGLLEKLTMLENDNKKIRQHLNNLTDSHNQVRKDLNEVIAEDQEVQTPPRKHTKTHYQQDEDDFTTDEDEPAPRVAAPKRQTPVPQQQQKKPQQPQPQQKVIQTTTQRKPATQQPTTTKTTQKKVVQKQQTTIKKPKPADEMDSELDYNENE